MAEPVDEGGPRLKLGNVTFVGNTAFSEKELRSKMTSESGKRYDEYNFEQDTRKIIYMYRKKGYLDAKFINTEKYFRSERQELDCILTIEEGNIRKIGQLRFSGNQILSDSLLLSLLKVKTGDPLNLPAINQTSSGIVALYAERGHIYTAVNDTVMETEDPYTSDILFSITEGTQVRLGETRRDIHALQGLLQSAAGLCPGAVHRGQVRNGGDGRKTRYGGSADGGQGG